MYYDPETAEARIQRLYELGYSDEDISVMMRDKDKAKAFAEHKGGQAAEAR